MARLTTRSLMESAFPPEELVTLREENLSEEFEETSRSILTSVGLPDDRSSFFFVDGRLTNEEPVGEFSRCAELPYFSQYRDMPEGWGNWLVIGGMYEDGVVLDPVSGAVYCLPDGEYTARTLNQNLDSFVYFLYLLQSERPNYDFSVSEDVDHSEDVAVSLRERMIRVDPRPFEGVEPAWSEDFDWDAEDAPALPAWDRVLWDVHESVG
ncbi:SUKH-4 family immunity protein [Streptomyces sp. NPDC017056]|uniref:SUKH-4 family immunity protein n=1 Tax=Streptomyces sp. NPDC017056 TaxID=3364973 RepID=UPI003790434B